MTMRQRCNGALQRLHAISLIRFAQLDKRLIPNYRCTGLTTLAVLCFVHDQLDGSSISAVLALSSTRHALESKVRQ